MKKEKKARLNNSIVGQFCDLHMHSILSDGDHPPTQLVEMCSLKGIKGMAITDHDILGGYTQAKEKAKELNIQIISGIELSTTYEGENVHLLGYRVDENNSELNNKIKKLQKDRIIKGWQIVDYISSISPLISREDFTDSDIVGRTHIAKVLIKKGLISGISQGYKTKYLADEVIDKVTDIKKISTIEGIHLIKQAGGVSVIAHPMKLISAGVIDSLLSEGKSHGLGGIETFYYNHTQSNIKTIKQLSKKYKLIQTGGSDFHNLSRSKIGDASYIINEETTKALFFK